VGGRISIFVFWKSVWVVFLGVIFCKEEKLKVLCYPNGLEYLEEHMYFGLYNSLFFRCLDFFILFFMA